jgi:hypothetical protein
MAFRSTFQLSPHDQANIAFLHPGAKLKDDDGSSRIGMHCKTLQLGPETQTQLEEVAGKSEWHQFRKIYLDALKKRTGEILADKDKIIDEISATISSSDLEKTPLPEINPPSDTKPSTENEPSTEAKPSAGIADRPARAANPDQTPGIAKTKSLLEILYEQLVKSIGPSGAQILTLQYPTRYLAKEEFQFEMTGIYSNFTKPTVVSEAEFRLTDQLYDAAAIVSAPNGKSLSTVYHQVLNNFVPIYTEADRRVRDERERIRSWLLTEVGDQDPYYKVDFNSSGGGQGDKPDMLKVFNSQLAANVKLARKMTKMEFASQLAQGKGFLATRPMCDSA